MKLLGVKKNNINNVTLYTPPSLFTTDGKDLHLSPVLSHLNADYSNYKVILPLL